MTMPQPKPAGGSKIGRDARRLLIALSAENASCGRTDLRDGFVAVSAPKHGVTAILASTPVAAGEELVARDLAAWSSGRHGRTLTILPEGRAHARRLATADDNPFAAQHRSLVVKSITPGGAPVTVDERESPLAWLARRKTRGGAPFLSVAQLEAGGRFSREVTIAQTVPRVTSDWSGVGASGGRGPQELNISDMAMAARQRLDRAAAAIGPELYGILFDVCGFQKGLETVERERAWPARSGKLVLRIALDRLAAHYGIASSAQGPEKAKGLLRWGAEDYRPFIDAPE
ncbi:MAG: ATPase [Hyphomicrobiales bacterium]|nr:ATPase [Hyphomicrobiales bacterium]